MTTAIGFIGFGEVTRAFARGLAGEGATPVIVYHRGRQDVDRWSRLLREADASHVQLTDAIDEMAGRTRIIFSAVVPAAALTVAQQASAHLAPSHLYVDVNSTSPAVKQHIAAAVTAAGARFVDAAIMNAVPDCGHRTEMLACGNGTEALTAEMARFGMRFEDVGETPGRAAAIKMCRSLILKGLAGLFTESLVAARRFQVEDAVLAGIQRTYPDMDWTRLAQFMLWRTACQAERRAQELEQAAETIASLGIAPIMARAASARFQSVAALSLADRLDAEPCPDYRELLDAIDLARP
jgi:3-hydroxyisobutyrate dehydrogenase-like beta-hydroxyacid dehydrogenase